MNNPNEVFFAALQEEQFLRSQLSVTEVDYEEAVLILVDIAQTDTGGAMVAAQVLLSLYNGSNWHVDLTDLAGLDYKILSAALIAIRGRIFVAEEPHNVIANGKQIFSNLEKQWQHLHVKNRYRSKYLG